MQVRHILHDKGRDVVCVAAAASLADAAGLMADHRIGALIVRDGAGELAGIISERDVVRMVARMGAGALNQPVSAVMTPGVPATGAYSTIPPPLPHWTMRGDCRP